MTKVQLLSFTLFALEKLSAGAGSPDRRAVCASTNAGDCSLGHLWSNSFGHIHLVTSQPLASGGRRRTTCGRVQGEACCWPIFGHVHLVFWSHPNRCACIRRRTTCRRCGRMHVHKVRLLVVGMLAHLACRVGNQHMSSRSHPGLVVRSRRPRQCIPSACLRRCEPC